DGRRDFHVTGVQTCALPIWMSVAEAAAGLGVTPGHLADAVKRATGRTPGELLRGARTLEAKRLLAGTGMTVAAVARAVGFADPRSEDRRGGTGYMSGGPELD